MACLLYYMVIKQAFQYKTKGIYLKVALNQLVEAIQLHVFLTL